MVVYTLELHFAKWACDRFTEDADFGKKKIIFSDEAHFDLGGYVNKQNCRIWVTENPHAYIEKPMHPKRVAVWCGFWSTGIIGPFFFQNEQEEVVQSMAICIGSCWTNFCSQKLKRRILTIFGFNRTALRTTLPKLHSMFCALFLKIALSAAELMSFGHFGVAIWHRWTIICGVPSKIRQARDNWCFKGQYSWSHWWNTAAHNR